MYRLTWILFTLFSLILPILSAPVAIPEPEDTELDIRAAAAAHTGRGTWYQPGLGSCGKTDSASELVVALSQSIMQHAYCGKTISISSNGKTSSARVVDTCPGCGPGDLDMSPALFQKFAGLGTGVITVKWNM